MSEIEANMLKAIKFKRPVEDFDERQDYLAAIVRKLSGMQETAAEEAMSKLTDEAYTWYCKAVEYMNTSDEIPDFPDVEITVEEVETEEPQEESDDGSNVDDGATQAESAGTDQLEEPINRRDTSETGVIETIPTMVGEEPIEGLAATEEVEREWTPSKTQGTPKRKQSKEVKAEAKAKKEAKVKAKKEAKLDRRKLYAEIVPDYKRLSGQKNRYGRIAGTKTDHAIKMLEEGFSMREIERVCGVAFYNLIKDLKKEGHRIQKLDHYVLKLTHSDDVKKNAKES